MISIIVCSIDNLWFDKFSKILENTIGVNFQILKIDNKIEKLSIAAAYNKAAQEAIFEIFVFVHEDVIFHTKNWGKNLLNHFEKLDRPGVLGVAGSNYFPISPCDWWIPDSNLRFMNFMDNHKHGEIGKGILRVSNEGKVSKVILLDGMFLAIKKEVFFDLKFDEELLGFHGYDTSICLRSSNKHQNYFIPDILIEHFSPGNPNQIWMLNTIKVFEKKPVTIKKKDFKKEIEEKSYHLFLNNLNKFGIDRKFKVKKSLNVLHRIMSTFFSMKCLYLWGLFQVKFLLFKK